MVVRAAGDVDLRRSIATLLRVCRFGVLATDDGTSPHLSLVAFAVTDDLESLIFATQRTTQKYANLRSNPRAAMLMDNRAQLGDSLDPGVAVTATGRAEEMSGGARGGLERLLLAKHPGMAGFVDSKTCALVLLRVDNYRQVCGLSEVRSLRISQPVGVTLDPKEIQ